MRVINQNDKATLRRMAGLPPLVERYESSADWDADMEKIQEHLKAALKIMDSSNWAKHIDDTESNFDVEDLREMHDKFYKAVEEAIHASHDFYSTMEKAA